MPDGPVVVYDDDHGYMGGVIADHLAAEGLAVTLITTSSVVSPFTALTLEQHRVQAGLIDAGVKLLLSTKLVATGSEAVTAVNVYGGAAQEIACAGLVLVTARQVDRTLATALRHQAPDLAVEVIGDALAPGLIADATFSGHLAARSFEADADHTEAALFRREMPALPLLQNPQT